MTVDETIKEKEGHHTNILFFKDLRLSLSEWCPFGQNAISAFNDSIDSLKGIKSSLLTGTVDEEPATSEFNIKPMFTRVMLEDFDMYNWIKFKAFIEYPEEVEQIEEVGTHVDKSGFINYALKMENVAGKTSNYSLDDTTAILADLVEDTSIMMEALLTQFQRRILRVVYGDTPFREKYIIAMTSALLPEQAKAEGYADGEDMQNEINQLVGVSYKYFDLGLKEKVILGTDGMILVSDNPDKYGHVLSFYSFVRSYQVFQKVFFNRVRQMWDMIKDLRLDIIHLTKEEAIGILQEKLSNLGADVVLIEEVMGFMRAGVTDMEAVWTKNSPGLDTLNKSFVEKLDIVREISVSKEKIEDMSMVSQGLVDEIQGLRDMLNTLAEKRMREVSNLMATNVQQGSDAQLAMAANVKASRYSGAALKILSMLSAGALGMKISDLVLKALQGLKKDLGWDIVYPNTDIQVDFAGDYFQVIVGFIAWFGLTAIFFKLIKASSDKMKEEKLGKDFVLHLRIPIDVRSTPQKIQSYIDKKQVTFHNVEITGHRISWYQKEPKGDDKIFYTMTMACDLKTGHVHYIHANTEDKKGDALFTTNFLLKEMKEAGLISKKDEKYITERMGFELEGGE
jgi:hypothetical protein